MNEPPIQEPDSSRTNNSPANEATDSPRWKRIAEIAEALLKSLGVAGVLLYGVGLYVSNTYYVSWGTSYFSILKPQCVLVGLWTIGLLAAAASPSIAAVCTWALSRQTTSVRKKAFDAFIAALAMLMLSGFIALLFDSLFVVSSEHHFLGLPPGWTHLLWWMNVPILMFIGRRRLSIREITAGFAGAFAVLGLIGASVVAVETYPSVKAEIGGGLPQAGSFLFAAEGESTYAEIQRRMGGKIDSSAARILEGDLILTTSDSFLLQFPFCSDHKNLNFVYVAVDRKLIDSYFVSPWVPPSARSCR